MRSDPLSHSVRFLPFLVVPLLILNGCTPPGPLRGDNAPRSGPYDKLYWMGPRQTTAWGMSQSKAEDIRAATTVLLEMSTSSRFAPSEQREAANGSLVLLKRLFTGKPSFIEVESSVVGGEGALRTWFYLETLSRLSHGRGSTKYPWIDEIYSQLEPLDSQSSLFRYWKELTKDNRQTQEMGQLRRQIQDTVDVRNQIRLTAPSDVRER
jgi:hypothetical protein